MNSTHPPSHDEIAQRAQTIWEQRGRPEGEEMEHWLQAERELRTEREQADRVRQGLSGPSPTTPPGDRETARRGSNGKLARRPNR